MLIQILKTMRPRQWTKNLMVFIPFAFTLREYWLPFSPEMWTFLREATLAFVLFCILSGVIYLINDLVDIDKDRLHPKKRFRPLASGALSKSAALVAIIVLLLVALPASFALGFWFGIIATIYFVLMLSYSYILKHIVILDVFTLAAGLVLRALGGAAAIHVPASPWLYVCTALLALFIGFAKRRHELLLLEDNATNHRLILKEYTPEVLDQMIAVTTASFVMAYSLYTFSAKNLPPNNAMMLTIPFALFVVFRLLYLVHIKGEGGSPEEMLLRDKWLLGAILLWGISIVAILYAFGRG
ncbi:MAG: decaprenyl-phosphate phosphoribosyltransferase [Anaerolineae bacterium]|nr:decaprenyl-phosphate phosphoribosyltransferase [Anaerolineae bacterium]